MENCCLTFAYKRYHLRVAFLHDVLENRFFTLWLSYHKSWLSVKRPTHVYVHICTHMYIHAQKLLYFQQIKHANNINFAFPSQLL